MSLEQLLPPPSKQKELLNRMVLNMTEEEYASKMQTIGTAGNMFNNNYGVELLALNTKTIIANESDGVFGF